MSQEPPSQPPLGYYSAPPAKSGMSKGAKIALGIIVGSCVVMVGCFACATFILDNSKKNRDATAGASSSRASTPTSSPASVTSGQYDALKEGMTHDDAVKILGTRYEVKLETEDKTGSSGVYQWGNAKDGFIILQFQNRKLYSKSQVSLKH